MHRTRRFFTPLLLALALFGVGVGATVFPAAPAYAQTAPTNNDAQGWQMWAFNQVMNRLKANPVSVQVVYTSNLNVLQKAPCWGCAVFDSFAKNVFTAGSKMSSDGDNITSLASVIVAMASLFSLFYIGSAFVSGDASDLIGRWKVFWQLLIVVAISTGWLASGDKAFGNTWNYVYAPIMSIPLAVAEAVPGPVGSNDEACGPPPVDAATPQGAKDIVTDMRKMVCGGHMLSVKGLAFGLALASTGDGIIGTILNMVAGWAVIAVFVWIAISFPLRFIDVLLRLCVVGIVTPVLIVCAAFKPTRSYTQIAISNVLYAGCLFAFTAIMFKLGGGFFDAAADARIQSMGTYNVATMISQSIGLVGAGIIFASMLKMAPALASEFSQFRGSSGGVGDAATNFAASTVTLPVKAGTAVIAAKTGGAIAGRSVAASLGKDISKE